MSARLLPLFVASALWVTGCALGTSASQLPHSAASSTTGGWRAGDDELSITMQTIANQLGAAGLAPDRQEFRGFLTTGARATQRFHLPANSCATLLAIASRGVHDMDAALYSPEGDVLAADTQPDAHPTMQVCNGAEPRAVYYALQVYEGAGSFVIAMFLGEQSSLERAAKVLGSRPAIARLGQSEGDGPGRVAAFREGLSRRGFEPAQPPMQVPLASEQEMRIALRVKPGQCYTAAGFALDGLRDVDLKVLDDEGSEIARDQSREEDASAQFCAERGAEYAAVVSGVQGSGTALLMIFQAEAAAIGGQSGLWLGERPLAHASQVELDDALAAVTKRSARDGFQRAHTLRAGRLGPGEAIAEAFALPAKQCARIHAVGGPGIRKLALVAKDSTGRTLASAEGDAQTTYVHVCSSVPLAMDLQLLAAAGTGAFTLAAFEANLSAVGPAAGSERVRAELQQALQQGRDAGYQPLADYSQGARPISLPAAEVLALPVAAGTARCVRAYVVANDPALRAQLFVDGVAVDEPAFEGEATRFCSAEKAAAIRGPVELRVWNSAKQAGDAWLLVLSR